MSNRAAMDWLRVPRKSDILARWLVVYFNPRVYAILSSKYCDVVHLFHGHLFSMTAICI